MNYFENYNTKKLRGFNLKIDVDVQNLCDLSNNSSSHTRAVLYTLMIISIISIIAVMNTFPYANWTKERIANTKQIFKNNILASPKYKKIANFSDSLNNEVDRRAIEIELDKQIENKVDKIGLVSLPIIGNEFDVNNLSLLTGIAFIIVLLITRYTASREKKNLRIALHAITERYPEANYYLNDTAKMIDIVPEILLNQNSLNEIKLDDSAVNLFNLTRRRYHYNYLSMNEVFNTPKDTHTEMDIQLEEEKQESGFKQSPIAKFVMRYLLYFPFWIYVLIVFNDIISSGLAGGLSVKHTIFQYLISYICLVIIAALCKECNKQKIISQAYYDNFKKNHCKFDYNGNKIPKEGKEKINLFIYPFWLFCYSFLLFLKLLKQLFKYLLNNSHNKAFGKSGADD